MTERKIHNYKSEILIDETIAKYGYEPSKWGKASSKFVMARCRFCGQSMDIRKGFFNKAGSACHKKCRLKEQKIAGSPFADPAVRAKAAKTNRQRYGSAYASSNKDVAAKISATKRSEEHKHRLRKTNLQRYGVENVFQSEEIKEKSKQTLLVKYGVDHPMRSKEIRKKAMRTTQERMGVNNPMKSKEVKDKAKSTNMVRYGVANAQQNADIKIKTVSSFQDSINYGSNEHYHLIRTLRGQRFWTVLAKQQYSILELSKQFQLDYRSLTSALLRPEFADRYYSTYHFPTQQQQNQLASCIRSITNQKIVSNTRSVISPLELDIYVPSLKFAIEFNGSYWHSEAVMEPKEAKHKHNRKRLDCLAKNIRLFHLFEHTWKTRQAQVLNFIKSILGKSKTRIGARQCLVNVEPCRVFYDNHHIQGYGLRTKSFFNLSYDGDIVASMSAASHHRQKQGQQTIVLNRLCFKDGVTVQGGASKLFKVFKGWATKEGYTRIVSWSDSCWTEGGIYKVLGFEMVKEYGPDYFYWDSKHDRYRSKQSQQKSKTGCPKDVTEREWCYQKNLYRIWDCGKKRWEYRL